MAATDALNPPPPLPVPPPEWEQPSAPDISHLVTEDDQPVDNLFSERQMRLLVTTLYASARRWTGAGRTFVAMANVGLFSTTSQPPIVPDVLVSLDVTVPPAVNPRPKEHRSYFVWAYGKPPDVVVEIVSNAEGGETDRKLAEHARVGVAYYLVFDPEHHVQTEDLRAFVRRGNHYVPLAPGRLEGVGLGVQLWPGVFEGYEATWLRWTDEHGVLLDTGTEQADAERARADALETENAALRAQAEELAARVRALEQERRG